MIVVFEGITNSGKTSICNSVFNNLKNDINIKCLSDLIVDDKVLLDISTITNPLDSKLDIKSELFLYAAILSRKNTHLVSIKEKYDIILVDRYSLTLILFFHYVRKIDRKMVKSVVDFSTAGIIPDLTLLINAKRKKIIERSKFSPFSRKDIGISGYYDEYVFGQNKEVPETSKYFESIDNNADMDLASQVATVLVRRYYENRDRN